MEILTRLLLTITLLIDKLLSPIFWLKARGPKKFCPKIRNPLLKLSATTLARKIRQKEISCEELTQAYIQRIKEVNPILNAVVQDRFPAALDEAKNLDQVLKNSHFEALIKDKPFFGVPVTIKESIEVKGMSYCVGSLSRWGMKGTEDAPAVKRLKDAGCIILLVSNTPEYCLSWECFNYVTGRTNNPYDPTRTSGGSSGGEGALLGSGGSVLGLGSDVAGSIRLPALYNGVFGHKPTARIVPPDGHFPRSEDPKCLDSLLLGPLTRYGEDLLPMMRILAAPFEDKLKLDEPVDIKKVRVHMMEQLEKSTIYSEIQKPIRESLQKAFKHLVGVGAIKSEREIKLHSTLEMLAGVFYTIKDIPSALNEGKSKNGDNFWFELLKSFFGLSFYTNQLLLFEFLAKMHGFVPLEKFPFYQNLCEEAKKSWCDFLKDDGVVLLPTLPHNAIHHNRAFNRTCNYTYCSLFNIFGCPATNVPMGLDENGLPVGIQVVAAPYQDRLCLKVAEELGAAFGGWIEPQTSI